ncbi:tRNA uracil 4-sulfurtransferase ThiI [Alkalicoccus luteus]|uniref:Probable tRNA sulfurtransferase n=1 Tax=Alkalicoccus luteus TaxID=1237094 RepID=A0A969PMM4_9BACI|nr:tRNA uracil 4-sulfurtransferase ThiI [Alkalicoccus luteus]NJP36986.1 tRNA 4-thiouridine(8) synthase ThiI [Alkalicoccus luteus]
MKHDAILIRYAELAIKGRNRKKFERRLEKNIQQLLKRRFPAARTSRTFGRLFAETNGEDSKEVLEALRHVFGISSVSPVVRTVNREADIKEGAAAVISDALAQGKRSFKVSCRRIDKTFPTGSQDMNQLIGAHLLGQFPELTVDVHHPDVELTVEIRQEGTAITGEKLKGAGGLPTGTGGRAMLLLSGGIDSPVAGFEAMKRGVTLEAVHFHSPPYTSVQAKQKVEDLAAVLSAFGGAVKLHVVPFTEAQLAVHQQVPDNVEITVMRRFMLRIAEQLAEKDGLKALISGESLGQVASQTLESMYAINQVTTMPVLRPLITQDKLDVIEKSQRIGTYDISIRPFEDCCTIFLPSDPKTKPNAEKVAYYESFLAIDDIVNDAVKRTEVRIIDGRTQQDEELEDLL